MDLNLFFVDESTEIESFAKLFSAKKIQAMATLIERKKHAIEWQMRKDQQEFLKHILESKNKATYEAIKDRIQGLSDKHTSMINDNNKYGKISYEKKNTLEDRQLIEWKTMEKNCGYLWCSTLQKFHFYIRNEDGIKVDL